MLKQEKIECINAIWRQICKEYLKGLHYKITSTNDIIDGKVEICVEARQGMVTETEWCRLLIDLNNLNSATEMMKECCQYLSDKLIRNFYDPRKKPLYLFDEEVV